MRVDLVPALRPVFEPPLGSVRYRVLYGGRGAGKSWTIAQVLLLRGLERTIRVLCAREFQSSIRDSVHRLLSDRIHDMGLGGTGGFYDVKQTEITGENGTEFIFKGIRRNVQEIKSTEGVDICWVEEAEAVSEESWRVLVPTIRTEGSEIWVSFNPGMPDDPTYLRFVEDPPTDERAIIRKIGYQDNPFIKDELLEEAEELRERDPEAYAHVWGGEPWMRTDSQVIADKCRRAEFEPEDHWDGPYYGADWGFARDPTVLVRCWIGDNRLWVDHDTRGIGWDNDTIERRFRDVPGAERHMIRADDSHPQTIHEQRKRGLRIQKVTKWKGSPMDGIQHLRSYKEIVIHPRCKGLEQEMRLWSYKTDSRTDDVLPKLKDGHDHGWDAIRYALSPIIRKSKTSNRVVRW